MKIEQLKSIAYQKTAKRSRASEKNFSIENCYHKVIVVIFMSLKLFLIVFTFMLAMRMRRNVKSSREREKSCEKHA